MIAQGQLKLGEMSLPVYSVNTLVIGSGAAGLNCAEHVVRYMEQVGVTDATDRVAVVTEAMGAGTSYNSGSDKQTYYRLGVCGDTSDTPLEFAQTLTAGGCMHGDIALCEAENSAREFYHLVENGVPFPHDDRGMFVGYKTDHDPRQRATSAGPWTSRFMVQSSRRQLRRYRVRVFERHELVAILTVPVESVAIEGHETVERRCVGAITVNRRALEGAHFGVTVWNCQNLVVATGGPGAMYEVSVYPRGQMGSHGVLFEAGCVAHNLTESQFGLASVRPRWNLSGTYQQVIPSYFSTNRRGGDKQYFLNRYFASYFGSPEEGMCRLASAVFLKGYQWPFDPDKAVEFGSSLIDLLVENELAGGRRVFMDFLKNPPGGEGLAEFDLAKLSAEARRYLDRSGAMQARPIDRLAHMNQPSIELYQQKKCDITREPLEVAVCNQHCNGGFKVNRWWQSNVQRLFCIGELAGTHGVKRPGGSALNATQVGGLRAAQYMVHCHGDEPVGVEAFGAAVGGQIEQYIERMRQVQVRGESAGAGIGEVTDQIGRRMSEQGGFLRRERGLEQAVNEAQELYHRLRTEGVKLSRRGDLLRAVQLEYMCLTHWAYLAAAKEMMGRGGGSRGSHMVLDPDGQQVHPLLPQWRLRAENKDLRDEVLEMRWDGEGQFRFSVSRVRPIPPIDAWFENTWAAYRSGAIYKS